MRRGLLVPEKMKLYLAMLALQFIYAGFHIVSTVVLNMGISKVVYPVYRNIIALLLLAPFAYFLEKNERPALTFSLLVQFFVLALCGVTANQGFYLLGLNYASPTFASAIQNSLPAITFVMTAALGLEQVNIKKQDGLAKVVGTIVSVGGAIVITLYKGPLLHHQSQNPLKDPVEGDTFFSSNDTQNWILGCVYLLGQCFAWSAWMVLQAPVLRKYPARLSVTSFTCFFGLIQFLVIAAFVETDTERWKIHSGGEILSILYAGIVASAIAFSIQIWCIDRGGPLFVAVFQPVQTVAVAIMASLILGAQLYFGGVIGAILIMLGLYSVLWGKSKEKRAGCQEKEEEILTKHLLDGENSDSAAVSDLPWEKPIS